MAAPARDPENPFVIDPYYFQRNTSALYPDPPIFDQPIPHKIHIFLVTFVGSFFTLLLIYLVLFRTPKDFRPYSRMLLLCALTDLVFLVVDFWCQIRPKVVDGVILFALNGPSSFFGYKVQCLSIILLMGVYILGCAVLPCQYFYRYCLMTRDTPLSTLQTIGLFCIALGLSLVDACVCAPTFLYSGTVRPNFDYASIWYPEVPVPQLVFGDLRYFPMQIYFVYAIMMIKSCYSLAIWFGYKTMKKMREMVGRHGAGTEKTQAMQRQFNRILIIQTIIPLLTAVSPLSYAVLCTFFHIDTGYTLCYMNLILPTLPLLNAVSTVLFVAPYRRFFIGLVTGKREEMSSDGKTTKVTHSSAVL